MKVIFLDIDGVLNDGHTKETIEGYTFVDEDNILLLKELIDKTGAKVVLSSTWRRGWELMDSEPELLTTVDKQDIRLFEALRDRLLEYGIELMSYTRDFARRGVEIDAWLKEWTGEPIEAFVILDDMSGSELRPHSKNLVQTGFYAGLEPKHVRKALEILNPTERKPVYYRVCRIRCTQCGDVLEHTFRTKNAGSAGLRWCSCGKNALDPHPFAYRVLGDDYEDLSEKWEE